MKRTLTVFTAAYLVAVSHAFAGGFERNSADISALFDDQNFVVSSGVRYVVPQRQFQTITPFAGPGPLLPAAPGFSGTYSKSYVVPSVTVKAGLGDHGACAGTWVQPFGASSDYSGFLAGSAPDGSVAQKFITNEFGLTCAARFKVGPGRLHFIGGVFVENFAFTHLQLVAPAVVAQIAARDSAAFGYRLGLAYDIPEYGLRGELLYRSAVTHNATGAVTGAGPVIPVSLTGTLPQSVEFKLRTGVAPGWLVFGSVKWADWSVLPGITVNGPGGPLRTFTLNYRDGWTVSAGVVRVFTEQLLGTAALVWDKGVGTGADIQTDTWTLALGGVYRLANGGEITAGGSVSYLTAGSQSVFTGANYNATAGNDLAYSFGFNAKIPF